MKNLFKIYTLSVIFFSIILLSLPANSQGESSLLLTDIENITEKSKVVDGQVDPLLGIAAVASAAIHSADSTVSTMVQIISLIGIIFTVAAAALVYLGFRSWNEVRELIKKQTEALNAEINNQHHIIDAASRSMIFATNARHEWEMSVSLSSDPDKYKDLIDDCYESALINLEHVISGAKESGNITLESWGYSMTAYIHKRLNNLLESINNAKMAISALEDFLCNHDKNKSNKGFYSASLLKDIKNRLPSKYYNLACYYCLNGDSKEKCLEYLSKSVSDAPIYKSRARAEEDLKKIWDDNEFLELTEQKNPAPTGHGG